MKELADSIKRFRLIPAFRQHEMYPAVEQLVELVAELHDPADAKQESDALTKAGALLSGLKDNA